jgi:hypothetical protein
LGSYRELYSGIHLLEKAGLLEEAEMRLRDALETGRRSADYRLTQFLDRVGRCAEAEQLRKYGIVPGGHTAQPR